MSKHLSLANPCRLLALLTLGIVVFLPGLTGGFLFDDFPNLVSANNWKLTRLHLPTLWHAMWSGQTSSGGRPLAMLSFALNHVATGLDPYWLKATSVAMHLANGCLAWRLVCRVLGAPRLAAEPTVGSRATATAAALVAAAWVVHPFQASTVLYVVQRMEIGAAFGVFCSLLTYLRFRDHQLRGARAWPWLMASLVGMLVGFGFKESAAVAPVLACLLEWLLFRFKNSEGRLDKRVAGGFAMLGMASLAGFLYVVVPLTTEASYAARGFTAGERLLTQAPVIKMYLQQALVPLPDSYRFYYDDFPISHSLAEPTVLLAIVLLAALVAVGLAFRRRWPQLAFGTAWFLTCHAITSSPIPLELAFEHRNYLALLGPLVVAGSLAFRLTERLHADARLTLGLVVVSAFAAMGWVQAATWGDPMRLALTLEQRAPQSARASYALGTQMIAASEGDTGSPAWSLGLATIERAAALPSASALPHQALIVLRASHGQPVSTRTWDGFRRSLTVRAIAPEQFEALYAVQSCRIARRCTFDDGELLRTMLVVLKRNPADSTVHTMYADLAWNILGDTALAVRLQRMAVLLAPSDARMKLNLARFLLASSEEAERREGREILFALGATERTGQLEIEETVHSAR